MALNSFTLSCDHHQHPSPGLFHHLKLTLQTIKQSLPLPSKRHFENDVMLHKGHADLSCSSVSWGAARRALRPFCCLLCPTSTRRAITRAISPSCLGICLPGCGYQSIVWAHFFALRQVHRYFEDHVWKLIDSVWKHPLPFFFLVSAPWKMSFGNQNAHFILLTLNFCVPVDHKGRILRERIYFNNLKNQVF